MPLMKMPLPLPKRSCAHDFIEAMPEGYQTEVNERGSRLSVGQRQLISFARALLADPRILVLDEATSSIDTETEIALQAGLQRLLKGRTSFVIAHRLSTIKNADKILYIDDGKIIEQGTHEELMAKGRCILQALYGTVPTAGGPMAGALPFSPPPQNIPPLRRSRLRSPLSLGPRLPPHAPPPPTGDAPPPVCSKWV